MATVKILQPREQNSHFGLYRTSAGGDESIFVRRKVGEPTDYEHNSSRKIARQREYLALASQDYAKLSPTQKAATRHQFEEVEFIRSHGKTDTKILTGRQLFIAKEIRSLSVLGSQLLVPADLCLFVCDPNKELLVPEFIKATLYNEWSRDIPASMLSPGYYLFQAVDPTYDSYQVKATRTCWNDYLTAQLPLKEFKAIRYCTMHAGLLVIEYQPAVLFNYAGQGTFDYIAGGRTSGGLHYIFNSGMPAMIPGGLASINKSITMLELNPLQWQMTISIPNSAFARREEPGVFWHNFSIYGRRPWAYVREWNIISGESCIAEDGSPPGTYDYLIWPQTLTKTTLP